MNTFIYLIKFIASMAVITIHTRFPGNAGVVIDAASRAAVPFFFVVSGRFLIPCSDVSTEAIRSRVSRTLKKVVKTTLAVYLVYLLYSLAFHIFNGVSVSEWFTSKFNATEALWFLLFNSGKFIYDGSYTFDHMWYLFALIYVMALIWLFAPVLRKWYKGLIVILLFLLFFGELLQTFYPIRPFGISITTWYVLRNWLLVGMPFVLIGIWFSDFTGGLKEKLGEKAYGLKTNQWIIPAFSAIILGIISSGAEVLVLGKKECPFGALLMVLGLLFLSETGIQGGKKLWIIGKEGSANIYYYHILVICIVDQLSYYGFIPEMPMAIKPIAIMILCLVFIWYIPRTLRNKIMLKDK